MLKSLSTKAMLAAGAATVAIGAVTAPAEAFTLGGTTDVNVGGTNYTLRAITGTYQELAATLESQLWFTGNSDDANPFVQEAKFELGRFSNIFQNQDAGALFVYGLSDAFPSGQSFDALVVQKTLFPRSAVSS